MSKLPTPNAADGPWCHECGGPVHLAEKGRYVYCNDPDCPGADDGPDSGEVAVERQQAPAGWPRPVSEGLPVAWIAPVIGGQVDWAGLNMPRLRAAAEENLCQVCGRTLGETVWFALVDGDIAAGGPLHEECMKLASSVCPRLREADVALIQATREVQLQGEAAIRSQLITLEGARGELPRMVSLPST